MRNRLTERDINRIVKRVVNEENDFVTGIAASERTELVDDVINRINEHGMKYIIQLNKLNSDFPVEKYKRQDRPRRTDFELPKGIRVSKSIFPED
jgi:vacuolar-type H+-ATPase subunit E/Vma4